MSAAVLFRGVSDSSRIQGWDRPWRIDYCRCLESHRRFLIEPLRDRFGGVDVFISTYGDDTLRAKLTDDYGPRDIVMLEFPGSNQRRTALTGLILVLGARVEYDLVVMSRFDAEFFQSPVDLPVTPGGITYPFRELEACWREHRKVSDSYQVFDGMKAVAAFAMVVSELKIDSCVHYTYKLVEKHRDVPQGFSMDHIGDSNTDKLSNPTFKLARVPR